MRRFPNAQWKGLPIALILLALLPSLTYAEPARDEWTRHVQEEKQFQLFTGCKPIRFTSLIAYHDDAIRALVENKLRQYGLYDPSGDSTLHLLVGSSGHRLEYRKTLYDPLSGHTSTATTWLAAENTSFDDLGGLLREITLSVNMFLSDYLRVNEKACASR